MGLNPVQQFGQESDGRIESEALVEVGIGRAPPKISKGEKEGGTERKEADEIERGISEASIVPVEHSGRFTPYWIPENVVGAQISVR